MRITGLLGVLWWVLTAAWPTWAESRGGTEVETRQGALSRMSAWWGPAPGSEARFWWEPDSGGAAWLQVEGWQLGALTPVPAPEGRVAWGPGSRQTGTWGAAWVGELGAFWAVQRSDSLEAGVQAHCRWAAGTLGGGGRRTWALGPVEGPAARWTDRGRVGGTWASGPWELGLEAMGDREDQGAWRPVVQGRITVGEGPYEVEGRLGVEDASWTGRVRAAWRERGWAVGSSWDRREGVGLRASVEVTWGVLWELDTEVGVCGSDRTIRGGLTASAPANRGRWVAGWSVGPGVEQPAQVLIASWKEPGLEASADWKVEGLRLGWFGPGARLTTKVRFLF